MSAAAHIALERRWMRPAGIAALAGALAIVGSTLGQAQLLTGGDSDAAQLRDFHAHAGTVILLALCVAAGFALFILPLVHLFRAAAAREPKVRPGLIGLMIAGPLFVGMSVVITAVALTNVASDFASVVGPAATDDAAHDLITNSTAVQLGTGLGLAGKIGVGVAVFYAAMWALRTGLLTRFVGTFGMATGAVFVLISFGVLIFFLILGLVLLFRPLPPAWAAGVAMPWPTAGQKIAKDLEGSGKEVDPDDGAEAQPPAPPRQKRKRRR